MKVGDPVYRYEDRKYAPMVDEFDNSIGSSTLKLELREAVVTKITPKGFWCSASRWVGNDHRKKAWHPTKKEALTSFIARKQRQARIYTARLGDAKRAIMLARTEQRK